MPISMLSGSGYRLPSFQLSLGSISFATQHDPSDCVVDSKTNKSVLLALFCVHCLQDVIQESSEEFSSETCFELPSTVFPLTDYKKGPIRVPPRLLSPSTHCIIPIQVNVDQVPTARNARPCPRPPGTLPSRPKEPFLPDPVTQSGCLSRPLSSTYHDPYNIQLNVDSASDGQNSMHIHTFRHPAAPSHQHVVRRACRRSSSTAAA